MTKASSILFRIACALLMGSMSLSASAQETSPATPTFTNTAGASANYRIGPGDILAIVVFRAPEYSVQLAVDPQGSLQFPVIGSVEVDGLTVSQVSDLLEDLLLSRGILNDPNVTTAVVEIRSKRVMVMGDVERPGRFPLDQDQMTISSVLAQAGANFGTGNGLVTVISDDSTGSHRDQMTMGSIISGQSDRPIEPDDIIVVQAAPTIYVSGEVGRPGSYPLQPNMTVGQALAIGGGITPRGTAGRLSIQRTLQDGTTQEIDDVDLADRVEPDDLILVGTRIF